MKLARLVILMTIGGVIGSENCGCAPSPLEVTEPASPEGPEFDEARMTRQELGYHGWALLHTIAAYFPANPSPELLDHSHLFVRYFGEVYPCKMCSRHFADMMKDHPPVFTTREEFMVYLCDIHNVVNVQVGKDLFDCSLGNLKDRWGGDADCLCGDSFLPVA